MPITWQNVNAPDISGGAARLFQAAGTSINDAFAGLRQELNAARAIDEQNFVVDRKNRLDALQANIMSRYATPQAFEAAKASGEVARLMETLAPQDALAGAQFVDQRLGTLQQRDTAAMAYRNVAEENALRPLYQQGLAIAKTGDRKALAEFIAANPTLAARYQGELTGQGIDANQKVRTFEDHLLTTANQRDTASGNLRVAEANADTNARNANTAAGQLALAGKQFDFNAGEKLEARLTDLQQRRAAVNTTISTKEGSQYVVDEIAKVIKDPKQVRQLLAAFGELSTSKEFGQISPGDALNALLGDVSTGGSIRNFFWDGTGDGAKSKLRDILKSNSSTGTAATRQAQVQALDLQINELRNQLYPNRGAAPGSPQPAPVPAPGPTPAPAEAPVTKVEKALDKQMQAEAKEFLAFDSKGLPKRTEWSPEVKAYREQKSLAAAADTAAAEGDQARAAELRRALKLSKEQLPPK